MSHRGRGYRNAAAASASGNQAVSVEDYSRQFVRRITQDQRFSREMELRRAARTLHALLRRLAQDGDREDVRVPFKVLKDEFGSLWRESSSAGRREGIVDRLFRIMDVIHEECVQEINAEAVEASPAASGIILEEFRLRVAKMVAGETWDDILPMRLAALKRMHRYKAREKEEGQASGGGGGGWRKYSDGSRPSRPVKSKSKFLRSVSGAPAMHTWSMVFDELFLKSGAKLAPLLAALLEENAKLTDELDAAKKPPHPPTTTSGIELHSGEERKILSPFAAAGGTGFADGGHAAELPPMMLTTRLSLHAGNEIDLDQATFGAQLAANLSPRPDGSQLRQQERTSQLQRQPNHHHPQPVSIRHQDRRSPMHAPSYRGQQMMANGSRQQAGMAAAQMVRGSESIRSPAANGVQGWVAFGEDKELETNIEPNSADMVDRGYRGKGGHKSGRDNAGANGTTNDGNNWLTETAPASVLANHTSQKYRLRLPPVSYAAAESIGEGRGGSGSSSAELVGSAGSGGYARKTVSYRDQNKFSQLQTLEALKKRQMDRQS